MDKFDQRPGSIGFHIGVLRAFYENDGSIGKLRDDGDRFRTAALQVSVGQINVAFNLITSKRICKQENGSVSKHRDPLCIDDFGRRMPNGLATAVNAPYRMGLLTVG